jgi:hypothetical protein
MSPADRVYVKVDEVHARMDGGWDLSIDDMGSIRGDMDYIPI